jgi:hypothetical protein
MVMARQGATASYRMLRRDGQMAIAAGDGKLRITEAINRPAAGVTSLGAKTIDDVLAHLRQTRKD